VRRNFFLSTAVLLAALSAAGVFVPGTAPAGGPAEPTAREAALAAHMARVMRLAGPRSGAIVYDMTTGRTLFAERATERRAPASVEKLYTATALLERMGPTARLETTVSGTGRLGEGGVWEGNLYLHGGGDPTFGSEAFIKGHYGGEGASVEALAEELRHADGIRRVTGSVQGDESLFDTLRGEPSSGYKEDPFLEGTLSALAFNRGETGREASPHGQHTPHTPPVPHAPAAYAAKRLRAALRAAGVAVSKGTGAAITPAGATPLAAVRSPTIAKLLGLTLPESDNFFAETLLKDLGARFAGAGSTAAGAQVVRETAAAFGLHPRVLDGSGLSEEDATSPYEAVTLLEELAKTPIGGVVRGDMAAAGRTGTLAERMRGTAAEGRCEGKTGTLTNVSNFAGYCAATDGHEIAFAFFIDGVPIEKAHTLQDNMAITLADY
jgi:D-alanyl-D-alanine carboxypeptidase/D-alanyl-D-alanine-endopeptidase (penicillin-binding protein 4)